MFEQLFSITLSISLNQLALRDLVLRTYNSRLLTIKKWLCWNINWVMVTNTGGATLWLGGSYEPPQLFKSHLIF